MQIHTQGQAWAIRAFRSAGLKQEQKDISAPPTFPLLASTSVGVHPLVSEFLRAPCEPPASIMEVRVLLSPSRSLPLLRRLLRLPVLEVRERLSCGVLPRPLPLLSAPAKMSV